MRIRVLMNTARIGIILTIAALMAACQSGIGEEAPPQERIIPVTVELVQPESVDVFSDYAGRARGAREVQVRARVGGILEERLYREGQFVEHGAALVRIDPEPFQIALRRAQAELVRAQAERNDAQREWARMSTLFERSAVSERERDRAQSALELAEAAVAQAEAGVSQAQLDLTYTTVKAPISGVVGLEAIPEGSLIERGTLLTTLTQFDPIHVYFALPENDAALQGLASRARGARDSYRRAASLILPDGSEYGLAGEVDFTDSVIDPRTGTVSARAVFSNPERQVAPGQFVRVWIEIERLENVFLIDPTAVVQSSDGPSVFVVDEEQIAHSRPVRLGPMVHGRRVVLEGLQIGDRLVVNGQVALGDGVRVSAQQAEMGGR